MPYRLRRAPLAAGLAVLLAAATGASNAQHVCVQTFPVPSPTCFRDPAAERRVHAMLRALAGARAATLHRALARHAGAGADAPDRRLADELASVVDSDCRRHEIAEDVRAALSSSAPALAALPPADQRAASPVYGDVFTALVARQDLSPAAYRQGLQGFPPGPLRSTARCTVHDRPVSIVGGPVRPAYPDAARRLGTSGTAIVAVTVDSTGHVRKAVVFASSESAVLDRSALAAARKTRYRGAIARCRAVVGTYLFEADFPG